MDIPCSIKGGCMGGMGGDGTRGGGRAPSWGGERRLEGRAPAHIWEERGARGERADAWGISET